MATNLEKEFQKILLEYREQMFQATEEALDKVSLEMQKRFEQASPVGNSFPHFKHSWDRKMQYKGVRYIGNTKRVPNDAGIPLSNILEYGRNGKPFIRRTWNVNRNEIFNKFIKELGGKV